MLCCSTQAAVRCSPRCCHVLSEKTEKKVTWLADTPDAVAAELVELDYLITVRLGKGQCAC